MSRLITKKVTGFVVTYHTAEFRGDHTADVKRVVEVTPETTIGQLVKDSFPTVSYPTYAGKGNEAYGSPEYDWLEICPVVKHTVSRKPSELQQMLGKGGA